MFRAGIEPATRCMAASSNLAVIKENDKFRSEQLKMYTLGLDRVRERETDHDYYYS